MHRPTELHDAFAGRRVFVTGHTGFKGSWLTLLLRHLGAEVTGFALPPEPGGMFPGLELTPEIRHVEGDIRDPAAVERALAESGAETVFHLAAQPLVRRSYAIPRETFEVNVLGTVNVLEALRKVGGVRAYVNVTSDKCYENREWVWGYRENDPMGGSDPYSASKGCAELVFASYQRSFFAAAEVARHGLGAATARAGNVIGGGDAAADRIVPDCMRALLAGQPINVRDPGAVRPWQHVLEPLSGYLLLAARLLRDPVRYAGGWNFGPASADCRPVRDVVTEITRAWQGGSWRHVDPVVSKPEAGLLRLCCDKAQSQLGWTPVWDFRTAIARTVEWYRECGRSPRPSRRVCLEQIDEYLGELARREDRGTGRAAA